MNISESFTLTSASPGPVTLIGGRYAVEVTATFGGGSVAFEGLGPDGSTYLIMAAQAAYPALTTGAFAANGVAIYDCPGGRYKLAITTATAVNATVTRVPV